MAVLAAGALVVLAASPASAVVAAAGPGSFTTGYVTPVVVAAKGGSLTFFNGDVATHTLTSEAYLPKKIARKTKRCRSFSRTTCPLFTTRTVGEGESGRVDGLNHVKPGRQYDFYCRVHSGMRGTLVVPGG